MPPKGKKLYLHETKIESDAVHYRYRLDHFISIKMPWYSKTEIHKFIEAGEFFLNGVPAKKGKRLGLNETIIRKYWRAEAFVDYDSINIEKVFENENFIAFNKPPTIAVHPNSAYQSGTMIQILEEKYGYQNLKMAHRIDKETSGLILFAKTKEYTTYLVDKFFDRTISKKYLAVVKGIVPETIFSVKMMLGLSTNSKIRIKQGENPKDGLFSHTDFKVIKQYNGYALIEATIHTGRQHQIRAHISNYGNYIIGDKIYGSDEMIFDKFTLNGMDDEMLKTLEVPRHFLHAYKISFFDDFTKQEIKIKAPLPQDMQSFLKKLAGFL